MKKKKKRCVAGYPRDLLQGQVQHTVLMCASVGGQSWQHAPQNGSDQIIVKSPSDRGAGALRLLLGRGPFRWVSPRPAQPGMLVSRRASTDDSPGQGGSEISSPGLPGVQSTAPEARRHGYRAGNESRNAESRPELHILLVSTSTTCARLWAGSFHHRRTFLVTPAPIFRALPLRS